MIADTRLSPEARVLVLHVRYRGRGPQEISFAEFSRVLNQASEKKVRRAVKDACDTGWIDRAEGGRGHSPAYTYSLPDPDTLSDDPERDSLPAAGTLNGPDGPDSLPKTAGLSDSLPPEGTLSDSLPKMGTLNGPHTREARSVSVGHSLRDDDEDDDVERRGGAGERLSAKACDAMERKDELLNGCRGALRDYLVDRVPIRRQYSYVQMVISWLEDGDPSVWKLPDGSSLTPAERTPMLATALNDLAASDESDMRGRIGEPRNLRAKVRGLLAERGYGQRNGSHTRAAAGETRRAANPTDEYPG